MPPTSTVDIISLIVLGRPSPSRLRLSRGQPQLRHIRGQRLAARLRLPRVGLPQAQVLGQVRRVPAKGTAQVNKVIT